MVFAKDTKKWIIVQNMHTTEFILIFKGNHRSTFTKYLLSYITVEESKILHNCLTSPPSVFIDLYLNEYKLEKSGLLYAITRMAESRTDILNFIKKTDFSKNVLPWSWPKGRLQNSYIKETAYECAKREFREEVEVDLPLSIFISDCCLCEQITTVTGRKIESRYWIYVIPNEIKLYPPVNNPEVSNRMWVDTDTCIKLIPHSHDHEMLFHSVENIL
jgi:hypothetical protein